MDVTKERNVASYGDGSRKYPGHLQNRGACDVKQNSESLGTLSNPTSLAPDALSSQSRYKHVSFRLYLFLSGAFIFQGVDS